MCDLLLFTQTLKRQTPTVLGMRPAIKQQLWQFSEYTKDEIKLIVFEFNQYSLSDIDLPKLQSTDKNVK